MQALGGLLFLVIIVLCVMFGFINLVESSNQFQKHELERISQTCGTSFETGDYFQSDDLSDNKEVQAAIDCYEKKGHKVEKVIKGPFFTTVIAKKRKYVI